MSLRSVVSCLQTFVLNQTRNRYVLRTSFRCFKENKQWNKGLKDLGGKEDKDLSKVRVTLKDQNGNIMGKKSLIEARLLAQKLKLNLIEDKDVSKHFKYKEFKLVSNQYLAEINRNSVEIQDNESENSGGDKQKSSETPKEIKHLVFSTKLNENDLMTKINQIKRWLSRGHQIALMVTNPKNDRKILDEIYSKFEFELKEFAKFNQKKIKSDNTLKFMILPNIGHKEQLKNSTSDDSPKDETDIENMDPNKLLSDDFEQELEKK